MDNGRRTHSIRNRGRNKQARNSNRPTNKKREHHPTNERAKKRHRAQTQQRKPPRQITNRSTTRRTRKRTSVEIHSKHTPKDPRKDNRRITRRIPQGQRPRARSTRSNTSQKLGGARIRPTWSSISRRRHPYRRESSHVSAQTGREPGSIPSPTDETQTTEMQSGTNPEETRPETNRNKHRNERQNHGAKARMENHRSRRRTSIKWTNHMPKRDQSTPINEVQDRTNSKSTKHGRKV